MPNGTVEINGKLYDAATGLPVQKTTRIKPVVGRAPSKPAPARGSKKIAVSSSKKIAIQQTKKPQPAAAKKPSVKPVMQPVNKVGTRRPAKSHTLSRTAVKKPIAKKTPPAARPLPRPVGSKPTAPHIAVKPSPIIPFGPIRRPQPTTPVRKTIAKQTTTAATRKAAVAKRAAAEVVAKKMRIRVALISISSIIVLVGGGIAAYLFVPPVSFWVATTRANVNAKLPTWAPDGYRVDGVVESSPGQITINYKSSSETTYSITQQNSTWDSNGVLENKVKPKSRDYQTLTQKGLTIYRFSSTAIWVNGGVLFTITDGNNLTNEEILQIIDSM